MIEGIRFATTEEIKEIADKADLTPTSIVLSLGDKARGVVRQATELDPVFFFEGCSDSTKYMFVRDVMNYLRLNGVREIYFNIHQSDERWREIAKKFGAQSISPELEERFKLIL